MEQTVTPLAPWQTAWPALPLLLMAAAGLWGLRREIRPDRWTWGILLIALGVRALWLPVWLHEYDGHEAEYLDLLMGRRDLTRGGPLLYPAVQWLHWGLGKLVRHPAIPVALSLGSGLAALGAFMGAMSRLSNARVARVSGAALAIWGSYAFWATSAYNVILPHALALVAIWALAVWSRGGAPVPVGLLAGGAAGLAVSTRIELWLVAPLGLIWLGLYRPRGALKALPLLAAGLGLGLAATALLLWPGQTPGEEQRALSWAINRGLFIYWDPFHRPWALAPLLAGLWLGVRRWPRLYLPLIALAVGSHCAFATFEDYGFRHLQTAMIAPAAALGALVTVRWGPAALALAAGALLWHTQDISARYYASEDAFNASVDASLPELDVDDLLGGAHGECALICEDGRVIPEHRQRSHFNLWDPDEAARMREEAGCVRWLYGLQDHRWSSRAVRDRALRLEHLYPLTPVARVSGEQGFLGVLYEVGERR